MTDLERYIDQRKQRDNEFAKNFEAGYLSFKLGYLLARTREEKGISQEQLANDLNWELSLISQLETQTENFDISTIEKYVKALGKKLFVEIRTPAVN
ncbi:MAG: helix-turn-helix domain-containing protein [Woronichinia naegeliana WA131]|jgi:ribosome-binding protein aMBF1 (putative translation factor)|uniref:Helix-turn-helix domain-containing protein n=1 Tax=Woronichinia naegeliana WA131 TaxID=2824559 RepID=A0A977PWG4_9CYAN|nr:MAG: helix-turn-helix domain-containing protein [Woronichinia naegeliana WA131]